MHKYFSYLIKTAANKINAKMLLFTCKIGRNYSTYGKTMLVNRKPIRVLKDASIYPEPKFSCSQIKRVFCIIL